MFATWRFVVAVGKGETATSPVLGTGDIERLKRLFPQSSVWGGPVSGNIRVTLDQFKTLYEALVRYYAHNEVSAESYQTGNFMGGGLRPVSNLRAVFDELIEFAESHLGLQPVEDLSEIVKQKQVEFAEDRKRVREGFLERTFGIFLKLGDLSAPSTNAIRQKLEGKLREYKERKLGFENEIFYPPTLLFMLYPNYQDTVFKILVVERVLVLKPGEALNLCELLTSQFEDPERGECLNVPEFYNACAVVASYLETPLPTPPL